MEFAQLYEVNRSNTTNIPHWKYNSFDLETLTKDECKIDFRYYLSDILGLPDEIWCHNNVTM